MTIKNIEQWKNKAREIDAPMPLTLPLHVLVGESVEVAKFVKAHWEGTDHCPGLCTAGSKLPETIADDILSLRQAVQDAQTDYRLMVDSRQNTKQLMERGNGVLNNITAVLEWHFDNGMEDDADVQLKNLKQAHADDTASADSLAQALHDYATLAIPYKDEVSGMGGFDPDEIDEAFDIAEKLGEVAAAPGMKSPQIQSALVLRNKLAHMLQQRLRLVRSAARFVFRHHPDLIKEATSSYERRRRSEYNRAKATESSQS